MYLRMGELVDGWMDGQRDGWMDGWIDGHGPIVKPGQKTMNKCK